MTTFAFAAGLDPLLRFLLAYGIHSTIVLGGLWLLLRWRTVRDPAVQECLWKTAIVVPIVTALLQSTGCFPNPIGPIVLLPEMADDRARPLTFLDVDLGRHATRNATDLRKQPSREAQPSLTTGPTEETPPQAPDAEAAFDSSAWSAVEIAGALEAPGRSPGTSPTGSSRVVPHPGDQPSRPGHRVQDASRGSPTVYQVIRIAYMSLVSLVLGITIAAMWSLVRTAIRTADGLRRCRPLGGTPRRLLDALLDDCCIGRQVALLQGPAQHEPASYGVWRWRIILPRGVERQLTPEQIEAILAHELAHLVRGDGLWLWIGALIGSLFVFQPLNRVAVRRWRRAAEFRCDDWAVERGVACTSLARSLTTIATGRRMQAPLAMLAAVGPRGHLTERVERLVGRRPSAAMRGRYRGPLKASVAAVAMLVACMLAPRIDLAACATAAPASTPSLPRSPEGATSAAPETAQVPVAAEDTIDRRSDAPFRPEPTTGEVAPVPATETIAHRTPIHPLTDSSRAAPGAPMRPPSDSVEESIRLLREAVIVLDGELAALEDELAALSRTVRLRAAGDEGNVAVRPLIETLERLRSRAGAIRTRRDELVRMVEILDSQGH